MSSLVRREDDCREEVPDWRAARRFAARVNNNGVAVPGLDTTASSAASLKQKLQLSLTHQIKTGIKFCPDELFVHTFYYLKLELLTQFSASNKWKLFLLRKNKYVTN